MCLFKACKTLKQVVFEFVQGVGKKSSGHNPSIREASRKKIYAQVVVLSDARRVSPPSSAFSVNLLHLLLAQAP